MLTLKDISGKKFEKAAFGYKSEDVDAFLQEVAEALKEILKDNGEKEAKLKFLSDQMFEYKQEEDVLKDAILDARKHGQRVVAEAKDRAKTMLEETEVKVAMLLEDGRHKFEDESARNAAAIQREQGLLASLQKEVTDFKKALFDMYKLHIENINSLPETEAADEEYEQEYEDGYEDGYAAEYDGFSADGEQEVTAREITPQELYAQEIPAHDSGEEAEQEQPVRDPFATSGVPAKRGRYEGGLQFGQNNK